jgi:4-hydroxyproline epimerase
LNNQGIKNRFFCIDAHTCGNPVRLVVGGAPRLIGDTMMERKIYFERYYDWIRTSLMFEPRGHDMMSGGMFFPPLDASNDIAVIFIETSGCLPMCGHGTIGLITIGIEEGLIVPKVKGKVRMEAPAGLIIVDYVQNVIGKVVSVKLRNVPSFLANENLEVALDDVGLLRFDVAYGGNFYAIVDVQKNFKGIENYTAAQLIAMSRQLRTVINEKYSFTHPIFKEINRCSHILWGGKCIDPLSTARNAVFYGDKAIDRSPCGTGTSARLAQWYAKGKIKIGENFIHESYIGSKFTGVVNDETKVGNFDAIIPTIEGWAKIYGYNTILVDESDDPYAMGFQVI